MSTDVAVTEDDDNNVDLDDVQRHLYDETQPPEEGVSASESYYIETGNSKKTLVLLAVGLKSESGDPLINLDASPWNKRGIKTTVKPSRSQYQSEVDRRAKLIRVDRTPRTNGWSIPNCVKWLEKYPIAEEADVTFIRTETKRFVDLTVAQANEEEEIQEGRAWRGNIPHLRLIHCLIQDDIKRKYLRRADSLNHSQLDGRNSEVREPTAYEMIADRWNSELFRPKSKVMNVHISFNVSHDLSHDKVRDLMPATAKKVEDYISAMRTHLIRIITNWERSGQGEGGEEDPDPNPDHTGQRTATEQGSPDFGRLRGVRRNPRALQTRGSFLQDGMPSYLLYFWAIADQQQIMSSTIQRINDDYSASDESSAPSVTSSTLRTRRRHRNGSGDDAGLNALAQSIQSLSQTQSLAVTNEARENERLFLRQRIGQLEDQASQMEMKFAECEDPNSRAAEFYKRKAAQITSQVGDLNKQLTSLNTTPQRSNVTPGNERRQRPRRIPPQPQNTPTEQAEQQTIAETDSETTPQQT